MNLPSFPGIRREPADSRAATLKSFDLWPECCTKVVKTAHPSTPVVFGIYPGTLSHLRRPWGLSRPPIFFAARHRRELAVGAGIGFPFADNGVGSPERKSSKGNWIWQDLSSSSLCWPLSAFSRRARAIPTWRMPRSVPEPAPASRLSRARIWERPLPLARRQAPCRMMSGTLSINDEFGRGARPARYPAGPSELTAPVALVVNGIQEGPRGRHQGQSRRDRRCSRSC